MCAARFDMHTILNMLYNFNTMPMWILTWWWFYWSQWNKNNKKNTKNTKHQIKVWSYHIIKRVIQLLWCLNRFNLVTKIILLNWMVYASRKNINVHIKRLFGHVSIYCKQFWHQYYHHSSRCMYIIPPTSSRNEFNFLPFIPLP